MRRNIPVWISAALILALSLEARAMNDTKKHLRDAQTAMTAFERSVDAEELRKAWLALNDVSLPREPDPKLRMQYRKECLLLWVRLAGLADGHLDRNFNPEDYPEVSVQPPPTSTGVVLPPGADPALIDDAGKRASYEKAIADNQAKATNYRLQTELRRLQPRVLESMQAFAHREYSQSENDKKDLRSVLDQTKDPQRWQYLLN